MKNVDLIWNLNSSAGAPREGLRQEDQSLNLQMILLLPNWSMEDPGKTLQSSERHGVLQRNMDRWKSKWRTAELASAVKPITLVTWDQVWKLQVLTHPGTSCFHGDLVFFTSLLLYKLALLSSYSSTIHPSSFTSNFRPNYLKSTNSSSTWVREAKLSVA